MKKKRQWKARKVDSGPTFALAELVPGEAALCLHNGDLLYVIKEHMTPEAGAQMLLDVLSGKIGLDELGRGELRVINMKEAGLMALDRFGRPLSAKADDEEVDSQGRLHLNIQPSPLPCSVCGARPAKRWDLLGDHGVLCKTCLSEMIDEMNASIGGHQIPAGYEPRPGDICLMKLRDGQYNLHPSVDGSWPYDRFLLQQEADELIQSMQLVAQDQFERFYYRPLQMELYLK